jgi:hypothetical protein
MDCGLCFGQVQDDRMMNETWLFTDFGIARKTGWELDWSVECKPQHCIGKVKVGGQSEEDPASTCQHIPPENICTLEY